MTTRTASAPTSIATQRPLTSQYSDRLGRIEARDLTDAGEHEIVEDVMRPGPTTIRADEDLASLNARMDRKNVDHIVVSRPDGVLIGVYHQNKRTELPS